MKQEIKEQVIITLNKAECKRIIKNIDMKNWQKYNLPIETKYLFKYIYDFANK